MTAPYRIETLARHDRASFSCGVAALDRYFKEQARQDMQRRITRCFVAIGPQEDVAGYYTLAATSVPMDKIEAARARKLPRYPLIPAVLLGRLAVAAAHQGKGLGAAMVADALTRAAGSDIAVHLMLVDAKDETAARFYEHLEFTRLSGGRRLVRAI